MTKKNDITCATLLVYDNKILCCHVTNNLHWDLPKGIKEDNEFTAEDAALRELREETGILLTEPLIPVCYDSYRPGKDIVLYGCHPPQKPIPTGCTSMFTLYGKEYPEMDDYQWVTLDDFLKITSKIMSKFIQRNREIIDIFLTFQ